MSRTATALCVSAVAGVAATGIFAVAPALAHPAGSTHTLHLTVKQVSSATLSKTQFSEADVVRSHGKKVGNDLLYGRVTGKYSAAVSVVVALNGGEMDLRFTLNYANGNSHFAGKVVGGTHRFSHATGTLSGTSKHNGASVTIVYHL